jgi:hypothetical protein
VVHSDELQTFDSNYSPDTDGDDNSTLLMFNSGSLLREEGREKLRLSLTDLEANVARLETTVQSADAALTGERKQEKQVRFSYSLKAVQH